MNTIKFKIPVNVVSAWREIVANHDCESVNDFLESFIIEPSTTLYLVKERVDKLISQLDLSSKCEKLYIKPNDQFAKRIVQELKKDNIDKNHFLIYCVYKATKEAFPDYIKKINKFYFSLSSEGVRELSNTSHYILSSEGVRELSNTSRYILSSEDDKKDALEGIKLQKIRNSISNYILFALSNDINASITVNEVINEIKKDTPNRYLEKLKGIKVTRKIKNIIKQSISVSILMIRPYFISEPGFTIRQIADKSEISFQYVSKISKNLELTFPNLYSHKKRFLERPKKLPLNNIRLGIVKYVFEKLKNNENTSIWLDDVLFHIDTNKNLSILKYVSLSNYLKKEIEKAIQLAILIIRPVLTGKGGLSIHDIGSQLGIDRHGISYVSKGLESEFPNVYNHNSRFLSSSAKRATKKGVITRKKKREAVFLYIFKKIQENWNTLITLKEIESKFQLSDTIRRQLPKYIKAIKILVEPFFTTEKDFKWKGINVIENKTNLSYETIHYISNLFEKKFGSNIYSHSFRFPSKLSEGHKYINRKGVVLSLRDIKLRIAEYIISIMQNNLEIEIRLLYILNRIEEEPLLENLRGIRITSYLRDNIKKFARAVYLILYPWYSEDLSGEWYSLGYISKETNLDTQTIRDISRHLENKFGKKIYSNLDRFPDPSLFPKAIRKGYPKIFFNREFRKEHKDLQTVIIKGNNLIPHPRGVFRDLLTGEPLEEEDFPQFHHIDYDKMNTSKGNMGWLSAINHGKVTAAQRSPKKAEYFNIILKNNLDGLLDSKLPKTWLDNNKSYLDFSAKGQTNLNKWLND